MKDDRGYACKGLMVLWHGLLAILLAAGEAEAESWHSVQNGDRLLRYSLRPTGENFTFQFDENPGTLEARLQAGLHVLSSAYEDESIASRQSSFFMKEGAKCFVFDGRFHTYTTCFLPNDYSPGNEERFWGYVTRVPNGYWLVTRNLLPAVLLLVLFALWLRRKPKTGLLEEPVPHSGPYRRVP